MSQQDLINIVLGTFGALVSWLYQQALGRIKEVEEVNDKLTDRINSIELLIVGQYVKAERFDNLEKTLFCRLDKFEDKLDAIARNRRQGDT